jgi:hypothetical protein
MCRRKIKASYDPWERNITCKNPKRHSYVFPYPNELIDVCQQPLANWVSKLWTFRLSQKSIFIKGLLFVISFFFRHDKKWISFHSMCLPIWSSLLSTWNFKDKGWFSFVWFWKIIYFRNVIFGEYFHYILKLKYTLNQDYWN